MPKPKVTVKKVDIKKLYLAQPTLKLTNVAAQRTDSVNGSAFAEIPGGLVHRAEQPVRMVTAVFVAECAADGQLDARIRIGSKIANPSSMTLTRTGGFETRSISGWAENIPAGDILIAVECKGKGTVRNRNLSIWIYE